MNNWKRKLKYGDVKNWNCSVEVHHSVSPKKNLKKRQRYSLGSGKDTGWDTRQEGFEGIDWENTNTKRRRTVTGCSSTERVIIHPQILEDKEEVIQSDIDNYSSDEDGLPNVQSLKSAALVKSYSQSPIIDIGSPTPKDDQQTADARKSLQSQNRANDFSSTRQNAYTLHTDRTPSGTSVKRGLHSPPDPSISQFESDSEEQEPQNKVHVQNEEESSSQSPIISQISEKCESPEKRGEDDTMKPRGSEWMKSVKWMLTSPERPMSDTEDCRAEYCDSSKKKKPKYLKGGLADRLQRLVARERSAVTFWQHKMRNLKQDNGSSSTLHLEIFSTTFKQSLLVAKCIFSKSSSTSVHQEAPFNEPVTVVFTKSIAQQCGLRPGTSVRIHPPWQKLKFAQNEEHVILCTSFCQVVTHNPNFKEETFTNSPDPDVIASWRCPCVKGAVLDTSLCPAHLNPCDTSIDTLHLGPATSIPRVDHTTLTLVSGSQSVTSQTPQGILESIEQRGGCSAIGVGFQATVQRVFCKRLSSTLSQGWYILVQDNAGGVCELQISTNCQTKPDWQALLQGSEGLVYTFRGLRVIQRVNKDRCPALFNLIESVWKSDSVSSVSLKAAISSQDTQDSECAAPMAQPPGFCYTLVAGEGDSNCFQQEVKNAPSSVYVPPVMCRLSQLPPGGRFSIQCKLVYVRQMNSSCSDGQEWFITDLSGTALDEANSGQNEYKHLSVRPDVYLSTQVLDIISHTCPVLLLKDVRIETNKLILDGYSRVFLTNCATEDYKRLGNIKISKDELQQLENTPIHLPSLSLFQRIEANTLISIKGQVVDVDNARACSWMVCDVCGSDSLTGGTSYNPFLHCRVCNQSVANPVTKIQLEVYLDYSLPKVADKPKVKVKLLQPTIKRLLPDEEDEEEGYELSSVLGQTVGPLDCIVETVEKDGTRVLTVILQEIDIKKQ